MMMGLCDTHGYHSYWTDKGWCGHCADASRSQSVDVFLDLVQTEIQRARAKHPTPIHSIAEGYAVILEELDEFWDEVRRQHGARDKDAMLKELVQIAAMCMRTAEDCNLITE
jgi:hypothetical protein